MKYRVRLDLSFAEEADARALMDFAAMLASKAESISEGEPNEEIAYAEIHRCRHDEGKPCYEPERIVVRKG